MALHIASAKMRPIFNNAFMVEQSWTCSFALAIPQICRNSGYMHGMPISKSLMEIGENSWQARIQSFSLQRWQMRGFAEIDLQHLSV
jgi:hypothetical protein